MAPDPYTSDYPALNVPLRAHPSGVSNTAQNYLWSALRWYELSTERIGADARIEEILRKEFLGVSLHYRKTIYSRMMAWSNQLIITGNNKIIIDSPDEGEKFRELGGYVREAAYHFKNELVNRPRSVFTVIDGAGRANHQEQKKEDLLRKKLQVIDGGQIQTKSTKIVVPPDLENVLRQFVFE